jgi:hypothetical protein
MSKLKITYAEAEKLEPVDVIGILNGVGIDLVGVATDVAKPLISLFFDKIKEAIANAGKNNPNSAKNVRVRLKEVEGAIYALNNLQKEVNRLTDTRLDAIESKLGITAV